MPRSNLARLTNGRSLPIEIVTGTKRVSNGDTTEPHDAGKRREIEFSQLPNGTLIDLVRDSSEELVLAMFKDGKTSLQGKVKNGDVSLIPPQVRSSLSRAVRFPTAVGASNSARELLEEIEDIFDLYFDCDPSDRKLLAYFALYSWVSDLLSVAPCIWVVGPYDWERTRLLQIMSAICRRSMLVGDFSMAALYTINTALRPTLLFDEFLTGRDSKSRDLLRMLRVGKKRGATVLRASGAYDLFGPKIIASREGPGEAALASLGFRVLARPFSKSVSMLTTSALESIAEQLQPKLTAFRFTNYVQLKAVADSQTVYAGLSRNVEGMARALALPITGNPELERQLLTIVEGHDKQARIARDSEPEWFVALALLHCAHTRGPGAPAFWTCKDLAKLVRFLAESTGESFNPTARQVGNILRSLGLDSQRLGSHGRGLKRSPELRDRIHQIASDLGICEGDLVRPEFEGGFVTCEYCVRYGLDFDSTGKKLCYEPFDLGPGIEPW